MNQYAPKIVRKSRTQPMAIASVKAFERFRAYRQYLKIKYSKRVIEFKTINPIPKHELVYDLIPSIYENEIHPNAWAIVGFIFSGLISFWTARLLYDEDFRYNCYIYYPREMKLLDDYTNQINLKYLAFKSRLPFKGDFPDLTQPENFNRFKRELKDYFFGVDEKIEQEKLIEKKIKEDSKEFDTAIKDMTNYLTETDKKLQKIKVVN